MKTNKKLISTGLIASSCLLVCNGEYYREHHLPTGLVTKKENENKATIHNQWELNAIHHRQRSAVVQKRLESSSRRKSADSFASRWEQEVHAPVHKRLSSTLADRICWDDGISCDADTTCINCCAGIWSVTAVGEVCGNEVEACLEDGTLCYDRNDYTCYKCCNPAYDNFGTTCGGQCIENGGACDLNTTCSTCCNYTYFKTDDTYQCGCLEVGSTCSPYEDCYSCCNYQYYQSDDNSFKCGCKEDGVKCIPGEDCFGCCNGAYDDDGTTCGGTCNPDGDECSYGEDCHLCCSGSSYWYSTGKMHCGYEPCYADGERCIPGQTCSNCCSGGAYDGDGTICGGECLPSGSECSYLGTCNKCCPGSSWWQTPTDDTTPSISPSVQLASNISLPNYPFYYGSPSSYWDPAASSMICGYQQCLANGTACIPGYTCYNCCSGAYADDGMVCGGQCLQNGTACNYHSTCNLCCGWRTFDAEVGSYVCLDYNQFMYDNILGGVNITDGGNSTGMR